MKTSNQLSDMGIVKAKVDAFLNGGCPPKEVIDAVKRNDVMTVDEMAQTIGVSREHFMKAACCANNKRLRKLMETIAERVTKRIDVLRSARVPT